MPPVPLQSSHCALREPNPMRCRPEPLQAEHTRGHVLGQFWLVFALAGTVAKGEGRPGANRHSRSSASMIHMSHSFHPQ